MSGDATIRKLINASVIIETSNALDAKLTHGCQNPLRRTHQMPTDTVAAATVTRKPVTFIWSRGLLIRLHVGASSSRPIATTRTRATTNSPSIPAAASAGSGCAQMAGA